MGVVVKATHLELLESRAIKVMRPHIADNAELCQRFLVEARTAARLKSQHVVTVFDFGKLDGGVPYMVMEYLDGIDFNTHLKQRGTLPFERAVLYVLQV